MKYYIDTCIWIDLYENREDNLRPLGEFAFNFFKKANMDNSIFIVSSIVEIELLRRYTQDKINEIFLVVENILHVEINSRQVIEAKKTSRILNIPFGDAAHAIIARDNGAILITRDKHFDVLRGIVKICFPEKSL